MSLYDEVMKRSEAGGGPAGVSVTQALCAVLEEAGIKAKPAATTGTTTASAPKK